MHVRTIGVEVLAVRIVARPPLRLGNQVNDVKAEGIHALRAPKAQDVDKLCAHGGVVPVEVCLGSVKQVQVPFVERRYVLPDISAELALPVSGRLARILFRGLGVCVHELVVGEVGGVAGQSALKPLVFG